LSEEVDAGETRYLEAVVTETLRLRPVISIVARRLAQPVEIGGWQLPAGVTVAPSIYLVHRRPEVYPEPERFEPERFLESSPGTYTWIPFGGGVRRCAGAPFAEMEMREVLRAAAPLTIRPVRAEPERARRSMLVVTPDRGGEIVVA
jgi:cytochrome P450